MSNYSANLPGRGRAYPKRSFATIRAIVALILREMATTYGRSPGGYLWAVLEPVGGIALLSAVFSVAFKAPQLGINFPMFYATGMLPFLLFNDISGKMATALMFSKQLLVYPSVTYIDALLARFILNLLTQLMVAYVVFTGIMLTMETRTIPNYPVIIEAFLLMAGLAMGIGVLNSFLFTRFPVWQRAWSVIMRPMFIISGIFLLPRSIPQPYRDYMMYNPIAHVIDLMRRGFYPSYDAPEVSIPYVVAISAGTLALGLVFLKRYHRDILTM
ncbi:MAG TPA: sugar ABC transporter permease [Aliiroseovarius sp.]|nr:sugar ABC transporter permease [Aliiroseovarius sp.]